MRRNAFTFIELMVVIAITGLVFAMTTVTFTNITKSSRDAKRKADLASISQALELCRSYSGTYPSTVVGGGTITCSSQVYMTKVPVDPKTGTQYTYTSNSPLFVLLIRNWCLM